MYSCHFGKINDIPRNYDEMENLDHIFIPVEKKYSIQIQTLFFSRLYDFIPQLEITLFSLRPSLDYVFVPVFPNYHSLSHACCSHLSQSSPLTHICGIYPMHSLFQISVILCKGSPTCVHGWLLLEGRWQACSTSDVQGCELCLCLISHHGQKELCDLTVILWQHCRLPAKVYTNAASGLGNLLFLSDGCRVAIPRSLQSILKLMSTDVSASMPMHELQLWGQRRSCEWPKWFVSVTIPNWRKRSVPFKCFYLLWSAKE